MAEFELEITLGNDDMRTPADVADALERVASQLRVPCIASQGESHQTLRDGNGNTVGGWTLRLPAEEED